MRIPSLSPRVHAIATLVMLVMATGCRPKSPETPPAPVPQPPEIAATQAAPDAVRDADADADTDAASNIAGKPTDAAPQLEDMRLAAAGSKIGVPVDLRYQFDAPVEAGRPATLHLAAVPRVPGSNLNVSVKESAGIDAVAAPITAQKATANQAYRQQLAVTRHAGAPEELRVLVTMDLPEGSAFGYFSVPFSQARVAAAATK